MSRWIPSLLLVAALALGACTTRSGLVDVTRVATSADRVGAICPITIPPQPGLAVPPTYPAQPPIGIWYGSAELWTVLQPDGSYLLTLGVWWSARFAGGRLEERPNIVVTWRRLDAAAEPIVSERGTNAFSADSGNFMIAGIDPPNDGCWEVTANYKGASLSYVVEIE